MAAEIARAFEKRLRRRQKVVKRRARHYLAAGRAGLPSSTSLRPGGVGGLGWRPRAGERGALPVAASGALTGGGSRSGGPAGGRDLPAVRRPSLRPRGPRLRPADRDHGLQVRPAAHRRVHPRR